MKIKWNLVKKKGSFAVSIKHGLVQAKGSKVPVAPPEKPLVADSWPFKPATATSASFSQFENQSNMTDIGGFIGYDQLPSLRT